MERAWEPWVTVLPSCPFSPAATPPHPSLNRKHVQLCQPGGPALEGPPLSLGQCGQTGEWSRPLYKAGRGFVAPAAPWRPDHTSVCGPSGPVPWAPWGALSCFPPPFLSISPPSEQACGQSETEVPWLAPEKVDLGPAVRFEEPRWPGNWGAGAGRGGEPCCPASLSPRQERCGSPEF